MTNIQKGYFLIFSFTVLAALSYAGIDFVYRNFSLHPANVMFWGDVGGILFGLPFFATRKKVQSLRDTLTIHWKIVLGLSLFIGTAAILWFWAMSQMSAGIVSLLDKTEVVWALLFGIFFLKESVRRKELLGIGLAILGIMLISTLQGEIVPLAVACLFLSSGMYAFQSFITKKFFGKIDSTAFTYLQGICLVLFIGVVFGVRGEISLIPLPAFLILGIGQLLGFVIGRRMYFEAHKYLDISRLNAVPLLVPVFVFLFGLVLFPNDPFSLQKIAGGLFVIGGLFFFVREHFRSEGAV